MPPAPHPTPVKNNQFLLLLIFSDSGMDSTALFPGASEKKTTTRKVSSSSSLPVFWQALWVIGLSVSACQRPWVAQWRPWSWLKAGAVRRLLNSLWQAGVQRAPRRLLLQRSGDRRCHRCLDCVWQEQLCKQDGQKTHRNQWMLGSSGWPPLLWCCSLRADLIVVSWRIGNTEADRN